jgi:hypothetical protein
MAQLQAQVLGNNVQHAELIMALSIARREQHRLFAADVGLDPRR